METSEKTKQWLMDQLEKAKVEETPYDVANGSRGWDQADHTPGIDKLANEIGVMEAELEILKGSEGEPEPRGIMQIDNPYDEPEEVEMVEPVKPNRHERRKRAKLARLMAMKEKLEEEKRRKTKGERRMDKR